MSLEREADEDQAGYKEGHGEPDSVKSGFGIEVVVVALSVGLCDEIVQPVAANFTDNSCYYRCEVEETL